MTNEIAKTISTCAIWLATAVILTFGLFRMNGSTEFFVFTTLIICGAAAGATSAVWYTRGPAESSSGQEPRPNRNLERTESSTSTSEEHGITRRPGV
jgi:hypothetical protein